MEKKRILLFLFVAVLVVLASIGGFVRAKYLYNHEDFELHGEGKNPELKFFTDRIEVFLPPPVIDEQSKPDAADFFALKMDLSRKEMSPGEFLHYYEVILLSEGKLQRLYKQWKSSSKEIEAKYFVKTFEKKVAADLSSRESYELEIMFDDQPLKLTVSDLNGDFITKNSLEYTRYLSVGDAGVSFAGKEIAASALVNNIYSSDYSKYLFFPGYKELKSVTHHLVLWDEAENFYLVDRSDVAEENPYYKTHIWLLNKLADGLMRKSFAGDLNFKKGQKGAYVWSIEVPEFDNVRFDLAAMVPLEKDMSEGIVTGKLLDSGGEREVSGFYSYQLYGP